MGIFPGSFYYLHRNGSGDFWSYQWYVAAADLKLAKSNCLILKKTDARHSGHKPQINFFSPFLFN